MKYLTAKQLSAVWGVTPRRIQDLCKSGAITGAVRHGREWLIPAHAQRPTDGRKAGGEKGSSAPAETLSFIDMQLHYTEPGSAAALLASLEKDSPTYDLFDMQIAMHRGNYEKAAAVLQQYQGRELTLAQRINVGTHMGLCAIAKGDVSAWKNAQAYLIACTPESEEQRRVLDFWIAAGASVVYDTTFFPDWFRRGDFSPLPKEQFPAARLYYVKYLYIIAHEENGLFADRRETLEFLHILPLIIEPLLAQTRAEGLLIPELFLCLNCAAAYHIIGQDDLANSHLDRALELALPDRLYSPLAEYRHRLGHLLDDKLAQTDTQALTEIKKLSKMLQSGWICLHNAICNRTVSADLSPRELQVAKLAVYGLSNKEIADRLNITVNSVKQTLRGAMDKTGAESRNELRHFL